MFLPYIRAGLMFAFAALAALTMQNSLAAGRDAFPVRAAQAVPRGGDEEAEPVSLIFHVEDDGDLDLALKVLNGMDGVIETAVDEEQGDIEVTGDPGVFCLHSAEMLLAQHGLHVTIYLPDDEQNGEQLDEQDQQQSPDESDDPGTDILEELHEV